MEYHLTQDPQAEGCRFCGGGPLTADASFLARNGQRYHLGWCSCGCATLLPKPSAEELAAAYDSSYYGEQVAKFSGPVERVIEKFRRHRARSSAGTLPARAKVLDIGCGNGRFLSYLISAGHQGYGVELPGASARRAATVPGLVLKVGRLEEGDFPAHFFDLITLWHVYEHLEEPAATLDQIARILKPGGYLKLSLPNIASWQARIFAGHWFHLDPPRHLFFQDGASLRRAVQDRGFQHISTSFLSLEQNPFGFLQSALNLLDGERDLLYELLKGNRQLRRNTSLLRRLAHWTFGLTSAPFWLVLSLLETAGRSGGSMELSFRRL